MFVLMKQKMVGKQSFIDIYKNTKTKKVNCFHFFAGTMVFDSSVYFSTWVLGLSGLNFENLGFIFFQNGASSFYVLKKKSFHTFTLHNTFLRLVHKNYGVESVIIQPASDLDSKKAHGRKCLLWFHRSQCNCEESMVNFF